LVRLARIPLATYRLQFNSQFTFNDARAIVEYLDRLGISDCYASSYLKAIPGSPHGYNVVDPTTLNPDIGTLAEYWDWIHELQSRGMSHVLDLVPNHMGIAKSANRWWQDVLENGPSSKFAHFFDIEWHPVKDELANRVLIPILGDQYGAVLERQELQLAYQNGAFVVHYHDVTLPVAPDSYAMILRHDLDRLSGTAPIEALDELKSIVTASDNLPPRILHEHVDIEMRAREKEIVKRRLAKLTESSPAVRDHVATTVARFNGTAGEPGSFNLLDGLLNDQSYRLAHWRVASEEINYRRFFDVNDLAAVRIEEPAVFEEVHGFVFELIRSGAATGLRIDHVDGLYAPADYLHRLQERAGQVTSGLGQAGLPFFIVVEKILSQGEQLPDWPIHGTTGYEFAAEVNNLFVDRRSEEALSEIYARFSRDHRGPLSMADLVYHSKKQVLHQTISGDINSLGHQLNRFSERNRHFRDFTLYSLISTLKEVIACFPVYRTYVTEQGTVSEHDRRYIVQAVRDAKRRAPDISGLIFDFIERLLLKGTPTATREECVERARFIGKFQQITGPVAAKGSEDTALYLYNRLISLNEVGSDPTEFGLDPSAVHDWMVERNCRWPHALSATSTHDTKRGEDVRARLNVLSEIPGAWKTSVMKWRTLNRRFKSIVKDALAPSANEEYLLYQTLVGAWPFEADEDEALERFRERIVAFMLKALREAKEHTSWLSPDPTYEAAMSRFIEAILDRCRPNPFLQAFLPFQSRVAELGIYNSLAQLVIKVTAPGVPDFYQGTEFWDLNLVDPDNRRPVDYEKRRRALACLQSPASSQPVAELLAHRHDGRVKLFVTNQALAARGQWRDVYERGGYVPLQTSGARRGSVFAFARIHGDAIAITCVPRLIASMIPEGTAPPLGAAWLDTRIDLPGPTRSACDRAYRDVFTNVVVEPVIADGALAIPAATLFDRFPVALLVPCAP
jgi:(1->4)-alpha-D-glucan 1-alpha-D-glucosylmutase